MMNLSKHDQRILSLLIEERDKLTSQPKAYRHADAVMKLNKSIVGIRNTAVYLAMPESRVDLPIQQPMTNPDGSVIRLLKKGESISLRAF